MYICMLGRNTEERLISLKQVILVWRNDSIKRIISVASFAYTKPQVTASHRAYM